jgi:hypothetical protein
VEIRTITIKNTIMKNNVTKIIIGDTEVYQYNGLSIDKTFWEDACCPLCCKGISEDDMCDIIVLLYDILVCTFGEKTIEKYIYCCNNGLYSTEDLDETEYDNISYTHCSEEEQLFVKFGAIYYEDME